MSSARRQPKSSPSPARKNSTGGRLPRPPSNSRLNDPDTPSNSGDVAAPSPGASSYYSAPTPHSEIMDLLMDSSFERALSVHADKDSSWLLTDDADHPVHSGPDHLPELPATGRTIDTNASLSARAEFHTARESLPPQSPIDGSSRFQEKPAKLGFFARLLRFFKRNKGSKSDKQSQKQQQAPPSAQSIKSTAANYNNTSPGKPPLPSRLPSNKSNIPAAPNGNSSPTVPSLPLWQIQGSGSGKAAATQDPMTTSRTDATGFYSPFSTDRPDSAVTVGPSGGGFIDDNERPDSGRSEKMDLSLAKSLGGAMSEDATMADWLVAGDAGNDLDDLESSLSTPLQL